MLLIYSAISLLFIAFTYWEEVILVVSNNTVGFPATVVLQVVRVPRLPRVPALSHSRRHSHRILLSSLVDAVTQFDYDRVLREQGHSELRPLVLQVLHRQLR